MNYPKNAPRQHSLGLRIWHWLDAAIVVGLITTFFLRNSLVSHSRYLVAQLNAKGIAVSDSTAKPIIREMVDQLWTWHIYLGYGLTALLLFRAVLFITDKRNAAVECWHAVCELRERFDFRNVHSAGVKTGYLAFYILQLFMVLSGLSLTFSESIGITRETRHQINEAHETVMWFFLAFVIAHIIGVVIAENRDDPGIISAMIKPAKVKPLSDP
ncbi:MAG: cytochrome b/b6 domain-containing protein [Bdellovibrionia bacterium]